MLGSHLRQKQTLVYLITTLAYKHQAATLQMENPIWTCPIWSYLISCKAMLCVWDDLDLLWECQGCLANREEEAAASSHEGLVLYLPAPVYLCVSNSLAQRTAFLPARQSRQGSRKGEEEAWNPFIIPSPPLCFALSFCSFCVSWVRLVECEGMDWGRPATTSSQGSSAQPERGSRHALIFSIKKPRTQTVKVPPGSNISPLINDAKMESLFDDHCKYRTH